MPTLDDTSATRQDLQTFLAQPGCAICQLALQSTARYFDALLYEGANDPAVHAAFEAGGAFCPEHAEVFVERRDLLAGALIYGNLVHQRLRLLEQRRRPGAFRPDAVRRTLPGRLCPACATERESVGRGAAILAEELKSGGLADAWRASPGLCWPHFLAVRQRLRGRARDSLDEIEEGALRRLDEDNRALVASFDYQNTQPRTPEMESSWRRAVDAVLGRLLAARSAPRSHR
jgi:hypothetical protein